MDVGKEIWDDGGVFVGRMMVGLVLYPERCSGWCILDLLV
jgi:hypothetical protein